MSPHFNIFYLFDRSGKRYSTTLNLNGGLEHGLTLELGAYVAKIQPGSVAAKEGSIAIGDRIVCVSKFYSIYRGTPPYVHFGTWKKPCYMKFVLVGLQGIPY